MMVLVELPLLAEKTVEDALVRVVRPVIVRGALTVDEELEMKPAVRVERPVTPRVEPKVAAPVCTEDPVMVKLPLTVEEALAMYPEVND